MPDSIDGPKSSLAHRFVGTLGTNLAIAIIAFGTGVLVARLLGPELRGELAAIRVWGLFAASLGLVGLPAALTYYSARKKGDAGSYAVTAVVVAVIPATVLAAALWAGMPRLLGSQPPEVVESARVFLWVVLIAPVFLPVSALRGVGRFAMWNALRFGGSAVWLCVLLLFVWRSQPDPHSIAVVYVAALSLFTVLSAGLALSSLPRRRHVGLGMGRQLLRFGIPNAAARLPTAANARIDQLLIAATLPSDQLGLYAVAVTWSVAARPLASAYGMTLMPRIAEEQDDAARDQIFASVTRVGLVIAVASGLPLLAVTRAAIPAIFGWDFADARGPAIVLVLAGSIWSYSVILREGLRGLGHPSAILWAELAGLPVSLIGLALLIGPFGLLGAAIASVCAYTTSAAVLIVLSVRLTGLPVTSIVVPQRSDFAAIVNHARGLVR